MNSAAIMAVTSHKSEKQMLQSYRGARHHQWCDSDPNIKSQASRELYRYKESCTLPAKSEGSPLRLSRLTGGEWSLHGQVRSIYFYNHPLTFNSKAQTNLQGPGHYA